MNYALLPLIGILIAIAWAKAPSSQKNPLLRDWWAGPNGGILPFDRVKIEDFKPAIDEAMTLYRTQIQAIANNPNKPTFENTMVAMEQSGRVMERVMAIYRVWSSSVKGSDFKALEKEMAPKLAAFSNEIMQNSKLFARIEAVFQASEKTQLSPEDQRLCWYHYNRFVMRGARLDPEQKSRVAAMNLRLAALSTEFSQNVLADEETEALIIENKEDLGGLPQSFIDGAAMEADRRHLQGKWVVANTRSSMEPFITYSSNRNLREKAFRIWTNRGDNANVHNNNKIVSEILKLRAERSKIYGFATYAHWHLADSMAKDPQAAMDLMMKVWQPAVARTKEEIADMQAIVNQEGGKFKIQPWDYRYYAEKVRSKKFDFDLDVLKPYLQLEHIREAMFWAAGKLYGFKFQKLKSVPVFDKSMSVYLVLGAKGKRVGLWYFDPYARPGKGSGAWMASYRAQQNLNHEHFTAIVSNNSNFIAGKAGEPVLISWTDAVTMFHEFGHALHGLNSNVIYPSLSGTNVDRDFVEFPSQLNEHWLETPEVLNFLTNAKGEHIPPELLQKMKRAATFNKGFSTVEFLASAIVDMKLHLAGVAAIDPKVFEEVTLKEIGMPREIVMRHRIPQFAHIFSGEGYASGYYSYLWAQVLEHDAFEAFTEAGGAYDEQVAKRLHDTIMSVGNTVDPAQAFRNFRGRAPKVDALLRASGFATSQ
jgi:peptidyl-dipeptidase Dcp